jgi:archaellum component FlaG (FlaF/FlaG flagellin family)
LGNYNVNIYIYCGYSNALNIDSNNEFVYIKNHGKDTLTIGKNNKYIIIDGADAISIGTGNSYILLKTIQGYLNIGSYCADITNIKNAN